MNKYLGLLLFLLLMGCAKDTEKSTPEQKSDVPVSQTEVPSQSVASNSKELSQKDLQIREEMDEFTSYVNETLSIFRNYSSEAKNEEGNTKSTTRVWYDDSNRPVKIVIAEFSNQGMIQSNSSYYFDKGMLKLISQSSAKYIFENSQLTHWMNGFWKDLNLSDADRKKEEKRLFDGVNRILSQLQPN